MSVCPSGTQVRLPTDTGRLLEGMCEHMHDPIRLRPDERGERRRQLRVRKRRVQTYRVQLNDGVSICLSVVELRLPMRTMTLLERIEPEQ